MLVQCKPKSCPKDKCAHRVKPHEPSLDCGLPCETGKPMAHCEPVKIKKEKKK